MGEHVHSTVPIKIWWRTRWICIHQGGVGCEYVFKQDVTGWKSNHKGDVAFRNDIISSFPRAAGVKLRWYHW